MPGPKESSLTINSYLSPLVDEQGLLIPIQRGNTTTHVNVRMALTCVSCDIPASRKVCGFLWIPWTFCEVSLLQMFKRIQST